MDEEELVVQPRKWVSKEEARKLFPSNEYFEPVDEKMIEKKTQAEGIEPSRT